MRLFKLITTALLLGLVALFFYENLGTFTSRLPFTLDLYIREQVSWDHPVYAVLMFAAILGFVAGVAVMLRPLLQMRRALGQEREEKEQARAAVRVSNPPASERQGEGHPRQEELAESTEKTHQEESTSSQS